MPDNGKCTKKKDVYTLSEWVKSVSSLLKIAIAIFKDPNVAKYLFHILDKYVVLAAKSPNYIVFVCKLHYIYCLIKELYIDNSLGNPTYTPTTLTKKGNPR